MKPLFKRGETFYYANRNTKQAEKCTVVDWVCQYPMAYIAKNDASGETINAYSLPKTYDAYFDMFLSQYNTTGLIDNMQ